MFTSSTDRGTGIRIGIADTGVGPHPYLEHVRNLGSILNGVRDSSISSGTDIESHGTHVSGLIAARPAIGSGGYAGLAEGAELVSIRIFTQDSGADQGDIAEAIETLSLTESADIINLSLGGTLPSSIEQDAIRVALENGTLCIVSAGNGYNQPVMYPAAYPEVIAVSAVGMLGADPPGTVAANCVPSRGDQFALGGLYLGNFSNIGPQIACAAPGVGIISAVPASAEHEAPYSDMSGTSLAAPIVCASLATLLSQYSAYGMMPRDVSRAQCAAAVLAASLRPLGLNPIYTGGGLCQGWPSY
jgi:subtilisin family serine protease